MQAYDALTEAGVKLYSVKTDCFTISAECEAKARDVLTFEQGIGSWRVSKTEDVIFPFETLAPAELEEIEFKHPVVTSFPLITSGTLTKCATTLSNTDV